MGDQNYLCHHKENKNNISKTYLIHKLQFLSRLVYLYLFNTTYILLFIIYVIYIYYVFTQKCIAVSG